nr:NACHT domain-containing protein [Pyxidicoccus fallax]
MLLGILAPTASHSQASPSPEHAAVVTDILGYAERHAKSDGAMQTRLVVDLFRDNPARLTSQRVARIYEEEYSRVREANRPGAFRKLVPNLGWVAALILLVLLAFRDVLKDWLTQRIRATSGWLYGRIAGRPFFWRTALRHYQQALHSKYGLLKIPFRPNQPLRMRDIYVPLKIKCALDADDTDAHEFVTRWRRLVVVGTPGAGKSMLLKHLTLSYAEGRMLDLPDRPVPILLELHRFNEPKATFEDVLEAELARGDFPQARSFVSSGLEQGRLMLLLDGLDEVSSVERKRVVQVIRDALDQYKKCRAIITCRDAVYRGEFDDVVEQRLEIDAFKDEQLWRFLGSWEEDLNRQGKSIEQLMLTLHDRPRIMDLARNPLMLTIIAYLYSDTDFVLPNSRAEFYRESTDILLDLWHQEHNRFKAVAKRLLLQHLALFNQDTTTEQGQERLTMERLVVLEQTRKLLPDLNIHPDEANAMLDEIVERSGLLLEIDGGERYRFAHLTLQEYLAATKLMNDASGMVDRFKADRDAWRETVKLWCGLDHDSTEFIRAIHAMEPLTAVECLADAQKVQPALANQILEGFKSRLGSDAADEAVVKAFGSIASDSRPRGEAMFQWLKESLATARDKSRCMAIAKALSLTNKVEAARLLAERYVEYAEARAILVCMGDLAVPTLEAVVETGSLNVLDDLLAIGTPLAAKALVPLLWHPDDTISMRAAWRMAALFQKQGVEAALREHPLTPEQRDAESPGWVWQPFNEPKGSSLPTIAGRVALLLKQAPAEAAPPEPYHSLDPRLAIPVCAIQRYSEAGFPTAREGERYLAYHARLRETLLGERPEDVTVEPPLFLSTDARARAGYRGVLKPQVIEELLAVMSPGSAWRSLFIHLPVRLQSTLLFRLFDRPRPTEQDWSNVTSPVEYAVHDNWHLRTVLLLGMLLSALAILHAMLSILGAPDRLTWSNGLLLLGAAASGLFWIGLPGYMGGALWAANRSVGSFLGPVIAVGDLISRGISDLDEFREFILELSWLPATVPLATLMMSRFIPGLYVAMLWGLLLVVVLTLIFHAARRERRARNPFKGLLTFPRPGTPGRRSADAVTLRDSLPQRWHPIQGRATA